MDSRKRTIDAVSPGEPSPGDEPSGKRSDAVSPDEPSGSSDEGTPPKSGRACGRRAKFINDRVHGQILIHPLLVQIIDSEEFQRLADIKQLGGSVYVYPSASHSRKEHSIGVCYLAEVMVRHLQQQQPSLGIDEDDVLCVSLAGLVHDIGHGPFSHMFEEFVHGVARRELKDATTGEERTRAETLLKWTHESMCEALLSHLLKANGIQLADHFSLGADTEAQLHFVGALVEGLDSSKAWPANLGRPREKRFLFDIVSCSRNGLDVDKLDYLVRDAMCAFGSSKPPSVDILRIIRASRVLRRAPDRDPEVCFEEKIMADINKVFEMRTNQHQHLYKHRVVNVAEAMVSDIFEHAKNFQFRGPDDQPCRLVDAVLDPAAYVLLDDTILNEISRSLQPGLEEARTLLRRLKRREFYSQVGEPVKLRMLPRCTNPACASDTELRDVFCSKCGVSTKDRAKEQCVRRDGAKKTTDGQPLFQSPDAHLTDDEAKRQILELCDPPLSAEQAASVLVTIVEIVHGKSHEVQDPHGIHWQSYDPIARVGFFNPKEEAGAVAGDEDELLLLRYQVKKFTRESEGIQGLLIPRSVSLRSLYCYIKAPRDSEGDGDGLCANLEAALACWKDERKAVGVMGAANNPTTPTTSRNPTPGRPVALAERATGSAARPMPSLSQGSQLGSQ